MGVITLPVSRAGGYYGRAQASFRDTIYSGMSSPTDPSPSPTPTFRTTLIKVMAVQVGALLLLWLVQARYTG